jgi:hypothetical protein
VPKKREESKAEVGVPKKREETKAEVGVPKKREESKAEVGAPKKREETKAEVGVGWICTGINLTAFGKGRERRDIARGRFAQDSRLQGELVGELARQRGRELMLHKDNYGDSVRRTE